MTIIRSSFRLIIIIFCHFRQSRKIPENDVEVHHLQPVVAGNQSVSLILKKTHWRQKRFQPEETNVSRMWRKNFPIFSSFHNSLRKHQSSDNLVADIFSSLEIPQVASYKGESFEWWLCSTQKPPGMLQTLKTW